MKKLLALLLVGMVLLSLVGTTALDQAVWSSKPVRVLRYHLIRARKDAQQKINHGLFPTSTPLGGFSGLHFKTYPSNEPGVKLIILTPTPKFDDQPPITLPDAITPISVIKPNSPIKPEAYHGSAPSPTE